VQAVEFIVKRQVRTLHKEAVLEALEGVKPGVIRAHAVDIGGVLHPIKAAFARATHLDPLDFGTMQARWVFERLGFAITRVP
jgi:hypothetical protein